MTYYVGTIEEAVAERVVMKLKNLKHVVKMHEAWQDLFIKTKYIETKDQKEALDIVDEFESGNQLMEYTERK